MLSRITAFYQSAAALTAPARPGQKAGNLRGIVMMLIGMACFVTGDASMKYMSDFMPTGEAMFIRGCIGSTIVGVIAIYSGMLPRLGNFMSGMLGLRTLSDVGGALFFQNGLARVPFADAGSITQINPLIVAGQVHGGIAQGMAQALYEEAVYDESGQLITGELMDYAVPKAYQLPHFELDHTVTETDVNPLGAKGVGEAGTIGATPAVANSVIDALAPLGVKHVDLPLRPEKLWRLLNQ